MPTTTFPDSLSTQSASEKLQYLKQLRYQARTQGLSDESMIWIFDYLAQEDEKDSQVLLLVLQVLKYAAKHKNFDIDYLVRLHANTQDKTIKKELRLIFENLLQGDGIEAQQINQINTILDREVAEYTSDTTNITRMLARKNLNQIKPGEISTTQSRVHQDRVGISEEIPISSMSLMEFLSSKQKKQQITAEVIPPIPAQTGSDQHWYYGTYTEVKNLYTIALNKGVLKSEDLDYLATKLNGWRFFTFGLMGDFFVARMILATLSQISKRQKIPDNVLDALEEMLKGKEHIIQNSYKSFFTSRGCKKGVCKTIAKKEFHNEPGVVGNFCERFFSQVLQNVHNGWFIVSYDCNDQAYREIFENDIHAMRIDAMTVLYNSACQDSHRFKDTKYIKSITDHLEDESPEITKLAMNFLSCLEEESIGHDYKKLFAGYLRFLEMDPIASIHYFKRKVHNKAHCLELMIEPLWSKIVGLILSDEATQEVSAECLELIRDYIQQEYAPEFPEGLLRVLFDFSIKDLSKSIAQPILKIILLNAEKKGCLAEYFITHYQTHFTELDRSCQCLMIMALHASLKSQPVIKAEFLLAYLNQNIIIVRNGDEVSFEHDDGKQQDVVFISSLVADIFLQSILCGQKLSIEVITQFVAALNSVDKATKIRCAKALYLTSHLHTLQESTLDDLSFHCSSSIYDVSVYAKVVYLKSLLPLSWKAEKLTSIHLLRLPSIFVHESMKLNGVEHQQTINNYIMDILLAEANKPDVDFQNDIFSLLNYLLTIDAYYDKTLFILAGYSKHHAIPEETVFLLDQLHKSYKADERLNQIYMKVIMDGRAVGARSLTLFVDKLYHANAEEREIAFHTLLQADDNQDLPDEIFDTIEMERACRANDLYAIDQLARRGVQLTLTVFDVVSRELPSPKSISILMNTSAVGHKVPEYLLGLLTSSFNYSSPAIDVLRVIRNAIKNNQYVSTDFTEKLIDLLDGSDKVVADVVLSIFCLQACGGIKHSASVARKIIHQQYEGVDDLQSQLENISAIYAILLNNPNPGLLYLSKRKFIEAILQPHIALLEFGLKGLKLLGQHQLLSHLDIELINEKLSGYDEVIYADECQLLVNFLNDVLPEGSRQQINVLLVEALSDENYLTVCSENSKNGVALTQKNFIRLGNMMKYDASRMPQIIELLYDCTNKNEIPTELIDHLLEMFKYISCAKDHASLTEFLSLLCGSDFLSAEICQKIKRAVTQSISYEKAAVDTNSVEKNAWIQNIILNRLKVTVNTEHLQAVVAHLLEKCGLRQAMGLINALDEIENLVIFDELIDFIVFENVHEFPSVKDVSSLRKILEINKLLVSISRDNHQKYSSMINQLVDNGWSYDQLSRLFMTALGKAPNRLHEANFFHTLQILVDHKRLLKRYQSIETCLKAKSSDWISLLNKVVVDEYYNKGESTRTLSELTQILQSINKNSTFITGLDVNTVMSVINSIKSKSLSSFIIESKLISDLDENSIAEWTRQFRELYAEGSFDIKKPADFIEIIAVINQAIHLKKGFYLNNAQLLSIFLAINKPEDLSIFLEVLTGEGKSVTIAVLAIVHALLGKKVNVATSSLVYAEEGVKQFHALYALFGLTVADNIDRVKYESGPKSCYLSDIVYGELAQFQFDTLRDEFYQLGTMAGRTNEFLLADELDTMALDDCAKIAKLSSTLPGFDHFQPVYMLLHKRLEQLMKSVLIIGGQFYFLNGEISYEQDKTVLNYTINDKTATIPDVVSYIAQGEYSASLVKRIDGDPELFIREELKYYLDKVVLKEFVQVRSHVKAFVESHADRWINSVTQAQLMFKNLHYVTSDVAISPVNFDSNGVVENGTTWSDGLQQFLQMKHGLPITSENLTTNFMSNLAYLSRFKGQMIGLTGTLGTEKSKQVLEEAYDALCVQVPALRSSKLHQYEPKLLNTDNEWVEQICLSAKHELKKNRGVYIICESIEEADLIKTALRQNSIEHVKSYTLNGKHQEDEIRSIAPGQCFIVTNIGGRCTHVDARALSADGGMHVILTFMPKNARVHKQNIGRTARQAEPGSAQMILNRSALVSGQIDLSATYADFEKINQEAEADQLDFFISEQIKRIQLKDAIFAKFSALFNQIRNDIRDKQRENFSKGFRSIFSKTQTKAYEQNLLAAAEEHWAFFLHDLDFENSSEEKILEDYDQFSKKLWSLYEAEDLVNNPAHHISIANAVIYNCYSIFEYDYKLAMKYLDKAISCEEDENFVEPSAWFGKAWLLIRTRGYYLDHPASYKALADEYFNKALMLVEKESSKWFALTALLENGHGTQDNSAQLTQLQQKIAILNSYRGAIQQGIEAIKKSRRLITVESSDMRFTSFEKDSLCQANVLAALKEDEKYQITFHDQTSRYDAGIKRDQAINTISALIHTSEGIKANLKNLVVSSGPLPSGYSDIVINTVAFPLSKLPDALQKMTIEYPQIGAGRARQYLSQINSSSFSIVLVDTPNNLTALVSQLQSYETLTYFTMADDKEVACDTSLEQLLEHLGRLKTLTKVEIKFEKRIHAIQFLNVCEQNEAQFNLKLHSVKKADSRFSEEDVANVSFSQLNSKKAIDLIDYCREEKITFNLGFKNLTQEQVADAIRYADLAQESIVIDEIKFIADYFPDAFRAELDLYIARGIEYLLEISELPFKPWISFCSLMLLASIQIAAGAAMVSTGFGAQVGIALISEGAVDVIYAFRTLYTREFSWESYLKQKAVSLVISAVSLGPQAFMNAARGTQSITSIVEREAIEQVGTNMITRGRTIGKVLADSGAQLQKLALKQVGVAVAEAGAKEILNQSISALSNFALNKYKPAIFDAVLAQVKMKLTATKLGRTLALMYFLDSQVGNEHYQQVINSSVIEILNPRNSFLNHQWETIAKPLCLGILSTERVMGSPFSMLMRVAGTLNGIKEIVSVIGMLHDNLQQRLADYELSTCLSGLLVNYCDVEESQVGALIKHLQSINVINIEGELQDIEFMTQCDFGIYEKYQQNVVAFLMKLSAATTHVNLDKLFPTMRHMADLISKRIIQVTESQLITPWSSYGTANLVSAVSTRIQSSIIKSALKKENKRMVERFEALEAKDTNLTDVERNELVSLAAQLDENIGVIERKNVRYTDRIAMEAAKYTTAFCQIQSGALAHKKAANDASMANMSDKVRVYAEGVERDQPASSDEMWALAANNDVDIKIVDEFYSITDEDRQAGKNIIVYITNGPGVGHWALVDGAGNPIDTGVSDDDNGCGYAVFSRITGKPTSQLRQETAQQIRLNHKNFVHVINNHEWIYKNNPVTGVQDLFIGAGKSQPKYLHKTDDPAMQQVFDAFNASQAVYHKSKTETDVLERIGDLKHSKKHNLNVGMYRNKETGVIYIAFEGIEGLFDKSGWDARNVVLSGGAPDSRKQSMKFLNEFLDQVKTDPKLQNSPVMLTGHSRGALLAQFCSYDMLRIHKVDIPAIVFDNPGFTDPYIPGHDKLNVVSIQSLPNIVTKINGEGLHGNGPTPSMKTYRGTVVQLKDHEANWVKKLGRSVRKIHGLKYHQLNYMAKLIDSPNQKKNLKYIRDGITSVGELPKVSGPANQPIPAAPAAARRTHKQKKPQIKPKPKHLRRAGLFGERPNPRDGNNGSPGAGAGFAPGSALGST